MKNKELFFKSVGVLQKAYFKGTLKHNSCNACAVGNLIADACKYSPVNDIDSRLHYGDFFDNITGKIVRSEWPMLIFNGPGKSFDTDMVYNEEFNKQVASTGYSAYELGLIEEAFEGRKMVPNDKENIEMYGEDEMIYDHTLYQGDEDGFQGLCNVLEVLMTIHEFDQDERKSIPPTTTVFNKLEICSLM